MEAHHSGSTWHGTFGFTQRSTGIDPFAPPRQICHQQWIRHAWRGESPSGPARPRGREARRRREAREVYQRGSALRKSAGGEFTVVRMQDQLAIRRTRSIVSGSPV